MAGDDEGDALTLGDPNSVDFTTYLRGKKSTGGEFTGNEFLVVEPDLGGPNIPNGDHVALAGTGLRRGAGVIGTGGAQTGAGVIGNGGAGGGNGLEGEGGTVEDGGTVSTTGGAGVAGHGGAGKQKGASIATRPGPGIVGMGGDHEVTLVTPNDSNVRQPPGVGVVGVAGGGDTPKWEDTANVGVFGMGGDEVAHKVPVGSPTGTPTTVVGALYPGPGVIGRGGRRRTQNGNDPEVQIAGGGAGVVGVSGGSGPLDMNEWRDAGVVGLSTVDDTGRGGIFSTRKTPQIRLMPVSHAIDAATGMPSVNGEPGDLLVTIEVVEHVPTASLWFCRQKNNWGKIA